MSFTTSDIKSVQNIVELCYLKGVEDVIISPGSRNAPLTIAFNQRKKFNCYSVVDERAAAFVESRHHREKVCAVPKK